MNKMILRPYACSICSLFIVSSYVHSYILFAANLDDLKNVARKLIIERVNMRPFNFLRKASMKSESNDYGNNDYDEDFSYRDYVLMKNYNEPIHGDTNQPNVRSDPKKHRNKLIIDKLTKAIKEKVLKELADEFLRLKTMKKELNAKKSKNTSNNRTIKNTMTSRINPKSRQKTSKTTNFNPKKNRSKQNEDTTQKTPKPVTHIVTEKIELGANPNDSYEDYIAPPKDEIIFDSAETPSIPVQEVRYKIQSNKELATGGAVANEQIIRQKTGIVKKTNQKSATIKPLSGLKDDETFIFSDEEDGQEPTVATKKKVKPTRPRFRMSSPNYYISLPTVAERYDFNEPIPESDRIPGV